MLGQQRQVLGTWACPASSQRCKLLSKPTVRVRLTPRRQAPYPGSTRMLPVHSTYRPDVTYQRHEPVLATPPSPLARATARILMLIPMAAALLGLTPRSSHAAWLTAEAPTPTSESIINDSTGLPHDWVISHKKWSHDHFDSIYSYYNTPETLHRPLEAIVVDVETPIAKVAKEKASSTRTEKSVGERDGAAAVASSLKTIKASSTPPIASKVVEKVVEKNNIEKAVEGHQSSGSFGFLKKVHADVAAPAVDQLSSLAVQAQAYGSNALSSANVFRMAVGEAVLSQVGALRTAAAAAKSALPLRASPAAAGVMAGNKKESVAKSTPDVSLSKSSSKTSKSSSRDSSQAAKQSSAAEPAASQLLEKAEALRSGLGAAVLSQRDALMDAASRAKASVGAALERPPTTKAKAGKGDASASVKGKAQQATKQKASQAAKQSSAAEPAASQLLEKAEALRSGLGAAVLSQRDALMDAASRAKASVGAALERPPTTKAKAGKGDASASVKGKAQQATKQKPAKQSSLKQTVNKTRQQNQQQPSSPIKGPPIWVQGFLSHAGATQQQLRQTLLGWNMLQNSALTTPQVKSNSRGAKASGKASTNKPAQAASSSPGKSLGAAATAAAERLSGALAWRPTTMPTPAIPTASSKASAGTWRSATVQDMARDSTKSSASGGAHVWGWKPTAVHPTVTAPAAASSWRSPTAAEMAKDGTKASKSSSTGTAWGWKPTAVHPTVTAPAAASSWRSPTAAEMAKDGTKASKSSSTGTAWGWNPATLLPKTSAPSSSKKATPEWGWNPTTVHPMSPKDSRTVVAPLGTALAPVPVELMAAGLILSVYLLGLARRLATVEKKKSESGGSPAGRSSDTLLPPVQLAPKTKVSALPLTVPLAAATLAVDEAAEAAKDSELFVVRSREELMADANKRIAAAKEAMARAAEQKERERELLEAPVAAAAALKTPFVGVSSSSSGNGAEGVAIAPTPPTKLDSSLETREVQPQKTRSFWEMSDVSQPGIQLPPSSAASQPASSAQTSEPRRSGAAPLEAFLNALDDRSHSTPLIALLSIASAALSGVAPLLQPPSRASARGPGAELVCSQAPGIGRQLLAGTSRVPRRGAFSSSSPNNSGANTKTWEPLDLLLAPAAPLAAFLATNDPGGASASSRLNKYDAVLDFLKGSLEAPGVQGDEKYSPVKALLELAPPRPGAARYDFARNLIRGLAAPESHTMSPFDMVHDLLQAVSIPGGKERFDPVQDLLHAALLVEDWGPQPSRYDPLQGIVGSIATSDWALEEWAGSSRYCPVSALVSLSPSTATSKFDPASGLSTWAPPASGSKSKYDVFADLIETATKIKAPKKPTDGSDAWDPVAMALDAAAGWTPPLPRKHTRSTANNDKYDPVAPALVALAALNLPRKDDGGARWDPLQWILQGWGGDWDEPQSRNASRNAYDPVQGMRSAEAPQSKSKFDWAQVVLHSESISPPEEGYRRVGQGGRGGGGNSGSNVTATAPVEIDVEEEAKSMSYGW